MASEFNRILALLRKERGITQKQAAADLGISQAQLSHYEKGIRECSLAFVVQVADYYGVSCDYLLGRSADRSGQTISVADLPETGASTSGSVYRGSVLPTMYKKLIENSLDILYDKLQESKDKQLVIQISQYLMLAVYKVFRRLYDASPKNAVGMFRIGAARWQGNADAAMHVAEAELAAALTGEDGGKDSLDPATLSLSTERLTQDYPRHATSLLNLVKNAEESMRALKYFYSKGDWIWGKYGFYDAFSEASNWTVPRYLAIDQCTIAPMIENYRTGLLWKLFMSCPEIQEGLQKLGFQQIASK